MNFKELSESQVCTECGGPAFTDLILAEKKDACYYKVKASAKVWPSAYASGRLVQCRKKGASNYGKSKNEGVAEGSLEEYGDTTKGQKMLTKVQKRAVDRMIKADDKRDAKAAKKNSDTANRAWDRMTDKDVAEAQLDEIGDTPAGQAALTAVQNRAYGKMDAWSANPKSGYSSTPKDVKKATGAAVSASNRLHGFGADRSKENTVMTREFAPAGSGGNTPPRGPRTPGRDPWGGNDGPGDDPYSRPEPEYYARSIDFFGRFEADHFDKEDFNERTGVFKGYWENDDGSFVQIAYFKFDDPKQAEQDFNDSPGMGWYYEPMDEGLMEQQLDEKCWDTHRQAGMKKKGDRMVPNCVPKESIEEEQMDLNKLKGKAQKQGAMDLSTLRAAAKTAKPASALDKDKKQQQNQGAMDLSTLRAAAKTAKPASELDEDYDPEYDDEAGMADNNLQTLERAVEGIDDLITAGDNLPEWCQEKIANAKSMLVAVWDYMRSEEDRDEDPEDLAMYEAIDGMAHALARKYNISLDEAWASFEALPDHVLYETAQFRLRVLNEDWQKVNKSDRTDGMSRKAVKAYRRENPGSKLKTAVTTKPSKLKKGGKAAKRRKSFCARMRGMKKSRASAKTKRNPNSPINKALRRWNC